MRADNLPGAIAEFREAIRITPALVSTDIGYDLCLALARSGDLAGAVTVVRQAIQQDPGRRLNPLPLLGAIVVMDQGEDSIRTLRRIREAAGGDRAVTDWIDRAISLVERITALGPRLPRIIHSASRSDACYADACAHRWFYATSAALWSAAFTVEPALLEDLKQEYRYHAACAAVMAASGRGRDEPKPDDAARAQLRRQALEWLKADLTARAKGVEGALPEVRSRLARTLRGWTDDPNLASLRDEAGLRMLPEAERREWRAFWSEVALLLSQAEKSF
jgi:hypothetical protein